ncbi:MAG: DUF1343 domain-containing protein [Negativicutes bacterium]|jgi:uncharacterized protein YbbC (DUF1343 family)
MKKRFLAAVILTLWGMTSMVNAASIKLGVDNLNSHMKLFAGKRAGLITNPTGVDSNLHSTIDVMIANGVKLTALYGPEHGVRGNFADGDTITTFVDDSTKLPVYSLYGKTYKPTPEMLKDVDVLCFDIQDVGARFYTFISTMYYAMVACKEQNKTFVVFDRPNPCGGMVEGAVTKNKDLQGFTSIGPLPTRHGMTVGELALMMNKEWGIGCDLTVIPMSDYKRDMVWADTGLQWINPSPNIPSADTALVYSGVGFFEATNVSEGRGLTKPFMISGAPWLNAEDYASLLNSKKMPGVLFRPAYFTPNFNKYQGKMCGGVEIHIIEPKIYRAVAVGLAMVMATRDLGADKFFFDKPEKVGGVWGIDVMTGDGLLRANKLGYSEILATWDKEATEFKVMSSKYYLYK